MVCNKAKGFTLIELLVVISIIGLLSTLAVYAINVARVKARDAARKAEVVQIKKALDLYSDNHGGLYPVTGGAVYSDASVKCLGLGTSETCFTGRFSGLNSLRDGLSPFIKISGDPSRTNKIFDNYLYSSVCHFSHAPGMGDKPCIYWQPEETINDATCFPGKMGNSGSAICGYSCYFCTLSFE